MGLKMDELIAELELLATDCKLEIAKGTLISLIDSNYENSTADFKSAVECEQTSDLFTPEKCRRHVDLCKEIYFLGKGRKYQKISLRSILHKGYIAANFGILMVWKGPKKQMAEGFKKDCIYFCKLFEKVGNGILLGKHLIKPEQWRERHQDYDKFLEGFGVKLS